MHYLRKTIKTVAHRTQPIINKVNFRHIFLYIFTLLPFALSAQGGEHVFSFLRLPYSSHAAALGGDNISLIDDDLTLVMHNPALLANVSDKTLNTAYMSYMGDCNVGGAAFSKTFGERSSAAVFLRYVDYGKFDGYTDDNIFTGTFSAKDIDLTLTYDYLLGERWSGGVSAKLIYSKYESMYALGLGVDLGINYFDAEKDFSMSFVCKNLGGQVKAFEEKLGVMPMDFQLGLTKRFAHAPIRLSAMFHDLHRWKRDDFYNADGSKDNVGELILKHFIVGADVLIGNNFYFSLGYNYRASRELSAARNSFDGFSIGAGLNIYKVKFNASYSKLHTSANSLLFNLSYSL